MEKIKTLYKNKWVRRVGAVCIGGLLGYVYHYFVGCPTGTCPLTANPYTSILYGAGIGLFLSVGGTR